MGVRHTQHFPFGQANHYLRGRSHAEPAGRFETSESPGMMVSKRLSTSSWLPVPWKGAGSHFTFPALGKRWQSLIFFWLPCPREAPGGLAVYQGRQFGDQFHLKPVREERAVSGVTQCNSNPCCSLCLFAHRHVFMLHEGFLKLLAGSLGIGGGETVSGRKREDWLWMVSRVT